MPNYRKKPVVIEARQLTNNWTEICAWINEQTKPIDPLRPAAYMPAGLDNDILIQTLEGDMRALPGDYIIKGVKGEFYPCKPDVFEATYDLGEDLGSKAIREADEAMAETDRLLEGR